LHFSPSFQSLNKFPASHDLSLKGGGVDSIVRVFFDMDVASLEPLSPVGCLHSAIPFSLVLSWMLLLHVLWFILTWKRGPFAFPATRYYLPHRYGP